MSHEMSYYKNEIESERYQSGIYDDTYYIKLIAYEGYIREVFGILKDTDKKARILDVGCGTGRFLALLNDRGYNQLQGLDIFS